MSTVDALTTAQIADRLGRDPRHVLRLVERGRLVPLAKLPGRTGAYLFNPADVDALVDPGPTHAAVDRTPMQRRGGDR